MVGVISPHKSGRLSELHRLCDLLYYDQIITVNEMNGVNEISLVIYKIRIKFS